MSLKHKVFFLILLRGKLNTRGMLKRKRMHMDSIAIPVYFVINRFWRLQNIYLFFLVSSLRLVGVQLELKFFTDNTVHTRNGLKIDGFMDIVILPC